MYIVKSMPSSLLMPRSDKNFIHVSSKGGAFLLNSIVKTPQIRRGGELSSNKIVGIISPAPKTMPPIPYQPNVKVASPVTRFEGGELLNKISFGKNLHNNKRDNIKFVF